MASSELKYARVPMISPKVSFPALACLFIYLSVNVFLLVYVFHGFHPSGIQPLAVIVVHVGQHPVV